MSSNKKTNKTSHVMNLLTNGASPEGGAGDEAVAENTAGSGQEKKGDVQSHTVTPSKVTVVDEGSRNDRLSQEIFNKLSEELEEETQADAAALEAAASQTASQPAEVEAAEETIQPEDAEPEPQDAPEAQTEAPQKEEEARPAQETPSEGETDSQPQETEEDGEDLSDKPVHHTIIPKSKLGDNLSHREYRFVNVMEQLILRQDMVKVLEQYNVCTCTRCVADVCALTLSALQAKYVVTSKDSISPLLSYYESRNKINMLTAMIKACDMVRENPRH